MNLTSQQQDTVAKIGIDPENHAYGPIYTLDEKCFILIDYNGRLLMCEHKTETVTLDSRKLTRVKADPKGVLALEQAKDLIEQARPKVNGSAK